VSDPSLFPHLAPDRVVRSHPAGSHDTMGTAS